MDERLAITSKNLVKLMDVLENLEELSPLDPVWDVLHKRLPDLSSLVRQKLQRRGQLNAEKNRSIRRLREAFKQFKEEYESELRFHEMSTLISSDQLPNLADSDAERALEIIASMSSLFEEHKTLRTSQPENITHRRRLEDGQRRIEEQLSDLAAEFSSLLYAVKEKPIEEETPIANRQEPNLDVQGPLPQEISLVKISQRTQVEAKPEITAPGDVSTERIADAPPGVSTDVEMEQAKEEAQSPEGVLPAQSPIWDHFAEGHFAEAYWLSQGLHVDCSEGGSTLSDVLLSCALQVSLWVPQADYSSSGPVPELTATIVRRPEPIKDLLGLGMTPREAAALVAAGSVTAALLEPSAGALGWLQQAKDVGCVFGSTISLVSEFAATSAWMDLKSVISGPTETRTEAEIEGLRTAASNWLQTARSSRFEFHPATQALRHLAAPNGPIGSLVETIIDGGNLNSLRDGIDKIVPSDSGCEALLAEALRSVGKPGIQITGAYRSRLHRLIKEAYSICRRYCDAAGSLEETQSKRGQVGRVKQFLKELISRFEIERTATSTMSQLEVRLGKGLEHIIDCLVNVLSGKAASSTALPWTIYLQAPLLRLREVPITPSEPLPERLSPEQCRELADSLSEPISLQELAKEQIQRKDFFSAQLVAELARSCEPAVFAQINEEIESALHRSRDELMKRLAMLRSAIEVATIDNTLSESDKSDFDAAVLSLEASKDLRLYRLLDEIAEWQQDLERRRKARAESLRQHLHELREMIPQDREDAVAETARRFAERAGTCLDRGDYALADEFIGRAEDIIRLGSIEPEIEESPDCDYLTMFMNALETLPKALEKGDTVRDSLLKGRSVAGIDMSRVPGARLGEIQSALSSLHFIKRGPKRKDRMNLRHDVEILVAYLGFLGVKGTESVGGGDDYHHFRVRIGSEQRSPIPQYGSSLNGVLDVIVVWERPDVQTLAGLIRQLSVVNPLVLYMGRLTNRQRSDWGVLCRENMLTVLMVDEVLIYFLAGQHMNRLKACISCSMPWGYANPYSFSGPVVPVEMFHGRQRVLQQLEQPLGTSVIYGGRQLGKSATLREFRRRYHRPMLNRYVVLRDIKPIGKPGTDRDPLSVWKYIADGLRETGLQVQDKVSGDEVSREIKTAMANEPDLRIWVLLDEADDFLRADGSGKTPFAVVQQLKDLMDSTRRRFKVVFSGLHSVQKYCSIPNHPFAHFEAPIVIGPLEPKAAISLIKEPLGALGFRFADDDAIYRILAYTNSHPALVQLFCSEIVKMNRKAQPPYSVSIDTVETVFRNQEIRDRMRERFEWTLDLDDRYAVLVYAIIDAQKNIRDGFRKQFTVRESLDIAREAWPRAFNSMDEEECRSLLDELIGLGIMVKTGSGYRLRNANIVTTLGSKGEIEERLRILGQKEPPSREHAMDRRSRFLQADGWHPLSLTQEAILIRNSGRVTFIFSSVALGADRLKDELREALMAEVESTKSDAPQIVTPDAAALMALQSWLRTKLSAKGSPLVVLMSGTQLMRFPEPLSQTIAGIQQVMVERAHRRKLTPVAIFNPAEIVQWYRLPQSERDRVLEIIDSPIVCRKWEPHALEMMLRDEGFLAGGQTVDSVRKATCGWPVLLHRLFASAPKRHEHYDPKPSARALRSELVSDSKKGRQFLLSTGLSDVPYGFEVVRFIAEMERIQRCDIDLMETPFIDVETRRAALDSLIDLGIVEPELRNKRKGDKSLDDNGTPMLIVDPLVCELVVDKGLVPQTVVSHIL